MTQFLSKILRGRSHLKLSSSLAFTKNNSIDDANSVTKKTSRLNKSPYEKLSTKFPDLVFDLDEKQRPKIGLVLSGGGFKGLAHLGVIRSLIEHNIPVDCVAGTSIGAIIGAIYCSKESWTLDEWDNVIKRMQNLSLLDLLSKPNISISALKNGKLALQRHDKLEKLIKSFIPANNFNQLSKPLHVVATSLNNNKKKVFKEGNLVEALLASTSLPFIFPHISIKEENCVDGGIAENIPTDEVAAQYIITSDVTSIPFEGIKTLNPLKLALNCFNWVQRPNVEKSLKRSDYTFHVKQDGCELSLKGCKKNIKDSYYNVENKMLNLIKSIKLKAMRLGLQKMDIAQ